MWFSSSRCERKVLPSSDHVVSILTESLSFVLWHPCQSEQEAEQSREDHQPPRAAAEDSNEQLSGNKHWNFLKHLAPHSCRLVKITFLLILFILRFQRAEEEDSNPGKVSPFQLLQTWEQPHRRRSKVSIYHLPTCSRSPQLQAQLNTLLQLQPHLPPLTSQRHFLMQSPQDPLMSHSVTTCLQTITLKPTLKLRLLLLTLHTFLFLLWHRANPNQAVTQQPHSW